MGTVIDQILNFWQSRIFWVHAAQSICYLVFDRDAYCLYIIVAHNVDGFFFRPSVFLYMICIKFPGLWGPGCTRQSQRWNLFETVKQSYKFNIEGLFASNSWVIFFVLQKMYNKYMYTFWSQMLPNSSRDIF